MTTNTTSMTHHSRLQSSGALVLGLILQACLPAAHAQSSYTMTVLSKPSTTDATRYIPWQIDDLGVVRGVSYERSGVTWGYGLSLLYTYWPQSATWAASTSATVKPTLGSKKFLPVFTNKQGTTLGQLPPRAWAVTSILPLFEKAQFADWLGPRVIRQGSVDTPFPAGSNFLPTAINNAGLIVGARSATPTDYPRVPAQLLNGVLTTLEQGNFDQVTPRAVNESGVIVGEGRRVVLGPPDAIGVQTEVHSTHPVMWINGRLSELNVPASMTPFAGATHINNAGQVLIWSAGKGSLWFNGVTTPLNLQPRSSAPTYRMAGPNDAGTIAGCESNSTTTWPFLWKNGVQMDLAQHLASKGIKPPTGYSWGCPTAINNAGSMIMYYWKPSGDTTQPNSTVVWVRLNAKP